MKTIKVKDLQSLISQRLIIIDERTFDFEEQFNWTAPTKQGFKKIENEIDKFEIKGNGWKVYLWYDISGFEYWHIKQEEPNYIQVTITFDKLTFDANELPKIIEALNLSDCKADAIQSRCEKQVSKLIQKQWD